MEEFESVESWFDDEIITLFDFMPRSRSGRALRPKRIWSPTGRAVEIVEAVEPVEVVKAVAPTKRRRREPIEIEPPALAEPAEPPAPIDLLCDEVLEPVEPVDLLCHEDPREAVWA